MFRQLVKYSDEGLYRKTLACERRWQRESDDESSSQADIVTRMRDFAVFVWILAACSLATLAMHLTVKAVMSLVHLSVPNKRRC